MAVQIQIRRGTASEWSSANPTLADGELGLETDTSRIKIGNGSTAWNSLAYQVGDITGVTAGTGLSGGGTSGAVTLSIDSTVATLTGTQTLTNKTISGSDNTLSNIPQSAVTSLTTDLAGKQAADADLTAIAALSGTSGLLRKTDSNTWSLDTSSFLTGNESISLSGDATGSGATSIAVTLANSGVTAGSYGSATAVPSITVDTKGRVTAASATNIAIAQSAVTNLTTDLAAKAPLASPDLTGTPTAPTANSGTNTTQIATTAFVQSAVSSLINGAPTALDTLNELAAALGNDASFASTVTNSLALKAPLASPSLTGTPLAPTAAVDTNTTQIATTAFVIGQGYLKSTTASSTYATLNSPTFTGTPLAPTAAQGTDTTQVATTAFVKAEIAATPASEPIHPFVTGVL